MAIKKYFEEYQIGETKTTKACTISASDIELHAKESGDFFPHHMDAAWCLTQPFKKRIAHGTLVFTKAIGLTADVMIETAMTYGYDRLRFIKPVFIDDTIKVTHSIIGKKDHKNPAYGVVTELVETHNQENDLVMVCEHLFLVNKMEL